MSPDRLEVVVRHRGRLEVLFGLLISGPLSIPHLVARMGETEQTVRYWRPSVLRAKGGARDL
jgi:hypothetical protein